MALLVIVINGYLLLDFFISEVRGFLFGFFVCLGTGGYLAFIIYLMAREGIFSYGWVRLVHTKQQELTPQSAFPLNKF